MAPSACMNMGGRGPGQGGGGRDFQMSARRNKRNGLRVASWCTPPAGAWQCSCPRVCLRCACCGRSPPSPTTAGPSPPRYMG